ncbi:MAG: SDR family oxidoreductase [Planctomycetes bacterium]|nr:SDR family oxidoreductase [Planctomycetota bacterium]
MQLDFTGKSILITGGSQGIGRAGAELLASFGAHVHINYAHNQAKADECVAAIEKSGGQVSAHQANLGEEVAVDNLWQAANAHAPIDYVILNAAYQKKASIAETDRALLEQTFAVNIYGNYQLACSYINSCRDRNASGSLVLHSSNQGEFVNPSGFAYALSKAALNHMCRHLAADCVKEQIRVNGVILGWFDTDGERKFYSKEQIQEQAVGGVPMQRAGDPMEAARLSAFLLSDASSYMTGSLLRNDGGFALAPDLST